ncbi:MAG: DUF2779 domain-containing protein [Candidatus Scalindua sp.]|jgi:hypothetical protein|nr:DUF2779 domain-containing protein [Candidatus Scalindua sp.]MBT5306736.1 DUF2779 domain-containing protein [Candidatus Scalindua sp.]MBT6562793.1 DUF2779 domain-containing protein [Candidatus Scalindua sp.]MBT7211430.1 DUF2779 domain-containing protein [Candidatus Scalindua sp.]MBT7590300.1 DUF2779 domain-containing protein [Candidatus Scalindua sp.]
MSRERLLTKSKYINGLQCPKYLWVKLNEPDRVPRFDPSTRHGFSQGLLVGEFAKKLFPDGIDIPADDFTINLNHTEVLLKERKPLFEVGIMVDNTFSRIDILKPVSKDEWNIIEVKSSTKVKNVNIHDVSYQKYCCENYGLKIRNCFLMTVNNEYIKQADIDPAGLLTMTKITAGVDRATDGIRQRVDSMVSTIASEKCPDVTIGKQCSSPHECPLKKECWSFLPENSIFDMYGSKNHAFELFEKGIYSFKDIPDDFPLSGKREIQKSCEISGKPHIKKKRISQFLDNLKYPLYYLDFETFSGAIPLFDGTRPYQQIPFQFSLHVVDKDNATARHYSFLADGTGDPRSEFISSLKRVLGASGSIVVYNQIFEKGVLRSLATMFPEYKDWVEKMNDRIIDLLAPFRSFHYYDARQKGSASIKRVLPVLTGTSYDHLDISDGMNASLAFLDIISNSDSEEGRIKIREDLEKYCALDTEGMIWIVDKLKELTND